MEGTIKIAVVNDTEKENAIGIYTNLKNVGFADKCQLIDALAKCLKMSDDELVAAVVFRKVFLDSTTIEI